MTIRAFEMTRVRVQVGKPEGLHAHVVFDNAVWPIPRPASFVAENQWHRCGILLIIDIGEVTTFVVVVHMIVLTLPLLNISLQGWNHEMINIVTNGMEPMKCSIARFTALLWVSHGKHKKGTHCLLVPMAGIVQHC